MRVFGGLTLSLKRRLQILLAVVLLTLGAGTYIAQKTLAAPTLPSGFNLVSHACDMQVGDFTDFAFINNSDTARLCIGKDGKVVYAGDKDQITDLGYVSVDDSGDLGLVGLALAKDYSSTGHIYLLYTYRNSANQSIGRLQNYYVTNPTAPTAITSGSVILDGIQEITGGDHGPGTVRVANDGTLFVGFGDASSFTAVDPNALRALDPNDPHGKILHINPDGSGVSSNFGYDAANPTAWASRVFASGFRNPFRFSVMYDTNNQPEIYAGDVGWNTWEDIKVARTGNQNEFGWPCYEGDNPTIGYDQLAACQPYYQAGNKPLLPLYTYNHNGNSAAVMGGVFATGSNYPEPYDDAYFFGDYGKMCLFSMGTDGTTVTRPPENNCFGSSLGGPVEILQGPDGNIFYADIYSGNLYELVYTPGNQPPTSAFSVTSNSSLNVSFNGSNSYDPDNDTLTYTWDFGDGTAPLTTTTPKTSHTYASSGSYLTTLTVTDTAGNTNDSTETALPGHASPTITWNANTTKTYAVGDTVQVTAHAVDQNGNDLSNSIEWTSYLYHCPQPTSCHIHPGLTATGPTFTTTIPDHGENSSLFITATATDILGAQTALKYQVLPSLHTLSVKSIAPVVLDGYQENSSAVVTNSVNSVSVPQTYKWYVLKNWSDGGYAAHSVTMPNADLTLTANYETAITQNASLAKNSFLGAPTDAEYVITGGRERDYSFGSEFWSANFGAHEVHGGILDKYWQMGGPQYYGFPTTDETAVSDGIGWYNNFDGGAIYWTSALGAHEVHGGILDKWTQLGRTKSKLGYPTSDEKAATGGRISYFQHGYIKWIAATDTTIVHYN